MAGRGSHDSLWGVFDRWFDLYRWWWCALAGLLLVASFAPFACATCGWIALVPAWWVLTRSERVRRCPFRYGYLVGLIYFGGVFWWISNVTGIGTFFLVLYLALYPAFWFLLVARLVARKPAGGPIGLLGQAFAAAAVWVTLEWLRSWMFTGFNWNELGISQAPSVIFRQMAAYGGVHLISFLLVAVNVLWAEGVLAIAKNFREKRAEPMPFSFGAGLFLVAIWFALGWSHLWRHRGELPMPGPGYACIQPNIPQIPFDGGAWDAFQKKEDDALQLEVALSRQAMAAKPDLLIWPEAIIDEGVFQDRPLNDAVRGICQSYDGAFLLGSQDFDIAGGRKLYNCAYLFTEGGDSYQEYRKTRLVILGEYLPFGDTFPWLRKQMGIGLDFTPGPKPERFTLEKPAVTFAPLICFEDTLPEVADKAVKLDPDFFVTITNDGWYWGWTAAWGVRQHLNEAVFRCVEHDRPMIRCANTGVSCEIDQSGTVTDRLLGATGAEIDVGGIFAGRLRFYAAQETIYEAWGDWIVLISALTSVMLGVRLSSRNNAS